MGRVAEAVPPADLSEVVLDLALEKRRLWSLLRMDGSKVRRSLDWFRLVDTMAAEARKLTAPRATVRRLPVVEVNPRGVFLDGGVQLEGLARVDFFHGAEEAALCAFTLGPALETRANELAMAGDYAEASVLSIIGDAALAEGQGRLRRLVEAAAAPSSGDVGPMLQPGSSHWSIEGNAIFARCLPLDRLDMRVLEESFALVPLKSKTFACALGRRRRGKIPW